MLPAQDPTWFVNIFPNLLCIIGGEVFYKWYLLISQEKSWWIPVSVCHSILTASLPSNLSPVVPFGTAIAFVNVSFSLSFQYLFSRKPVTRECFLDSEPSLSAEIFLTACMLLDLLYTQGLQTRFDSLTLQSLITGSNSTNTASEIHFQGPTNSKSFYIFLSSCCVIAHLGVVIA